MKLNDALTALGIKTAPQGSDQVNALQVAISHEFDRRTANYKKEALDYRERALNRCINRKVSFTSEGNSLHTFLKKYVRFICPCCDSTIQAGNGGGTADTWSANFECQSCKTAISLRLDNDGIYVKFPEKR